MESKQLTKAERIASAKKVREDAHDSPTGRYQLAVSSFSMGKGYWNYTQGVVMQEQRVIATVQRNYGVFPFLWVEDHANGHDYLVCGEDYQGQTVIELDTSSRVDNLPKEAAEGHAFCWAAYKYHADAKLLVVEGCYWACPYEFKFFDFADPICDGWPELETTKFIGAGAKDPTISGQFGEITTYELAPADDESEDEDTDRPVAVTMTFRRNGLKLDLVAEWVSPDEQKRREEFAVTHKAYEEWKADFWVTDPLMQKLKSDSLFTPDIHFGIGQTYSDWCPTWSGQERLICYRLLSRTEPKLALDLEWAHISGPIKLIIYKNDQTQNKYFEHSVEGMEEALSTARALLT